MVTKEEHGPLPIGQAVERGLDEVAHFLTFDRFIEEMNRPRLVDYDMI